MSDQKPERYQHLSSGVIYRVTGQEGQLLIIESIGYRQDRRTREELNNHNVWRRMP